MLFALSPVLPLMTKINAVAAKIVDLRDPRGWRGNSGYTLASATLNVQVRATGDRSHANGSMLLKVVPRMSVLLRMEVVAESTTARLQFLESRKGVL